MDVSSIIWAAAIGATAGGLGAALGYLFPKRIRPVIVGVAIAAAIGFTGPIKTFVQQQTMTPDRFEREAMEDLKSNNKGVHKIMLLYKEHQPDLYRSIMEKAAAAFKDGQGKNKIADIIRTEIGEFSAAKIKDLGDEGVLQVTDLLSAQMRQLAAEKQDSICMKMMRQEPLGAVQWSDEMIDLEYQMARALVMDPGGVTQVVEQKKVEEAVNAAVLELMELHGQEKVSAVFGVLTEGGAAPEGSCLVLADYFRLLKKAGGSEAAVILRTLFAS
jgi:hypothetical protein